MKSKSPNNALERIVSGSRVREQVGGQLIKVRSPLV